MGKWKWSLLETTWDVQTDTKAGTITVKDKNGEIVTKKVNLTKDTIKLIEDNFFDVVAERLTVKEKEDINPMYA